MKKALLTMICIATMMVASTSLKAQEVTITLNPGWTWISYLGTEPQDFATALGSFTPEVGDVIKSQWSNATYMGNGQWRGNISQFYPGYGYMYYSSRPMPVFLTFNAQQPVPQVVVTTMEPTDITINSATCGGNVASSNGDYVTVILRGICWSANPNPTFNDNFIEAGNGLGSFTVSLTELTPNTTYYVRAFVVTPTGTFYGEELNFITLGGGIIGGHDYVDLGLPSGLLWATCNVGADTPEAYGDYFAWGETTTKSTTYDWSTYQYCNGSDSTLTRYCSNSSLGYNGFTDNLTTLLPEDDAATANWGSGWRMPAQEEWQELCNNTTVTWTTQNGVNGRLFTASNGNSLFLPAAGCRWYSSLSQAGSTGFYWSSSLDTYYPDYAWNVSFNSGNYGMIGDYRIFGRSVRPVRSGLQSNTPTGAIDGKFTINDNGDQVYFSQGNLQYQASTNTWKFAENQYDYVGSDNSNISSTYDGWIDLFGWGTSGYNHGANCYQPWSTSQTDSDYYAYGSYTYDLYHQTGQADWGYNPISNGGNQTSLWRTLTHSEWDYIFSTRTTTSGIRYAKASVNNVNGVILLPDDWNSNTYSLSNTNSSGASFSSNTITFSQWAILEDSGAVFLPVTGERLFGTSVTIHEGGPLEGNYYSASYVNDSRVYIVCFSDSDICVWTTVCRSWGESVRLVHDANN